MKKAIASFLTLALMVGAVTGCASSTPSPTASAQTPSDASTVSSDAGAGSAVTSTDGKIKVGFANMTDSGDYMIWVKDGMQKAAEDMGVELICVDNKVDGAVAVQNIDTLINSGVQCVIEYMNDTAVNTTIKDKLDEAGIPCIAIDVPVENANGKATYFGGDNHTAGYVCGENLGKAAKERWDGKVDLFISVQSPSTGETSTLRNNGILEGIRSVIEIPEEIIVRLDGKEATAESQKVVSDALTANPNAKNILIGCQQDDETQGAFAAVEMAGRQDQVLLAGCGPFGSTIANLRLPEPNFWIGSTSFCPELYGKYAIDLAVKLVKGEPVPAETYPDHYFLTHENINEHYPA